MSTPNAPCCASRADWARPVACACVRPSSAHTPCPREWTRMPTSTPYAKSNCRRSWNTAWPMPWTPFVSTSLSTPPRWSGSSLRPRSTGCRSSCTQNNCPIAAAANWPRATGRCPATTSNISVTPVPGPWPQRTAWRSCCRARSTSLARPASHRSSACANWACRWPSPPTSTPVLRRCIRPH